MDHDRTPPFPAGIDQAGVTRFFTHSFMRHLKVVSDWAVNALSSSVQQRGHPAIRRTHELVFVPMKLEGSRLTDIAQASGVTKNAIGQLASELEGLGYVRRQDHPEDGRAKLLCFTDAGLAFLADAMAANAEVESTIAALIGTAKASQLAEILEELAVRISERAAQGT